MVRLLDEIELIDASVARTASVLEAARVLLASRVSAIAVLDVEGRVVGLFTDDDVLRAILPGYVRELRHTAFLETEEAVDALAAGARKLSAETVERHMREPITVDLRTSAIHIAERFLHAPWGALAVVEDERFVGMVDQLKFVRALMRRLDLERE
jgi:CBS domain-containing protein